MKHGGVSSSFFYAKTLRYVGWEHFKKDLSYLWGDKYGFEKNRKAYSEQA